MLLTKEFKTRFHTVCQNGDTHGSYRKIEEWQNQVTHGLHGLH
jgi:hypothetical protein